MNEEEEGFIRNTGKFNSVKFFTNPIGVERNFICMGAT